MLFVKKYPVTRIIRNEFKWNGISTDMIKRKYLQINYLQTVSLLPKKYSETEPIMYDRMPLNF